MNRKKTDRLHPMSKDIFTMTIQFYDRCVKESKSDDPFVSMKAMTIWNELDGVVDRYRMTGDGTKLKGEVERLMREMENV